MIGAAFVGLAFVPASAPAVADDPSLEQLAQSEAQRYDASLVSGEDGAAVADERGDEYAVDAIDPTDKNALKQIASEMASDDYGWGAAEFSCLDKLWEKESGWNPYAENPGSGAYGIPQSYPGEKMAAAGADWKTNPITQMRWGMDYIKAVYSTPCAAWNQHNGSY